MTLLEGQVPLRMTRYALLVTKALNRQVNNGKEGVFVNAGTDDQLRSKWSGIALHAISRKPQFDALRRGQERLAVEVPLLGSPSHCDDVLLARVRFRPIRFYPQVTSIGVSVVVACLAFFACRDNSFNESLR